ncbi:HEAT repeat domain-containing protein [uncultured Hymenobacter sp.]|uniref:HEAT repeat domain-containing protein n=1 Tax=uncultured Hymenobacter sp. TaxID=170016 RepID=UPI0035CC5F98
MTTPAENHSFNPDCAASQPCLAEYADGTLLPAEAARVAAHLAACPACQAELTQLRTLLHGLDALPAEVPPLALRENFLAMLAREKAALAANGQLNGLAADAARSFPTPLRGAKGGQPLVPAETAAPETAADTSRQLTQQWLRIAASVGLVAVGAALGLLLRWNGPPATAPLAAAPAPATAQLASQLTAAAIRPATATDRLRLVNEVPAQLAPGDPAVQALIHTLDADPNPNVRLAACEALFRLRADPRVGPALVEALPLQTDPNVQITLIEMLVALREKRALPQLEQLSQQPGALPAVRQQAANGVGQLI